MLWYASLAGASLIASALAIPTGHVLHEKRMASNHIEKRRVLPDSILPMRFALTQRNLETGYDRLMEVSDPSSARYGRHFSAEEVHAMFEPAAEALQAVKSWLIGAGIPTKDIKHYHNRGWLAVDMPAFMAEKLLATQYHEHDFANNSTRIGCEEYYLPAHVAPHVEMIKPGVVMSARIKKRSEKRNVKRQENRLDLSRRGIIHRATQATNASLANCDTHVTPPCLYALYGIPAVADRPKASPNNTMGLYESLDAFSQDDLNSFFTKFLPYIANDTTPTVYSVDGGKAPVPVHSPYNTGESDVDLELAYSLIYPQTVTVYEVDDIPNASGQTNKSGFLNDFLDAVDGSYCKYTAFGITGNSPNVDPVYPDKMPGGYKGQTQCGVYPFTNIVSISYGEEEAAFPKNYLQRQCSEIMKLGLQGHSILIASGDYGVASFPGSNGNPYGCLANPNKPDKFTIFNPDAGSSCPYITSVGGTRIAAGASINEPEVAMQVNLTAFNIRTGEGSPTPLIQYFGTSGGFSNFFEPPAYQKTMVEDYIKNNKLPPSYEALTNVNHIEAILAKAGDGLWNRNGRGWPDVSANGAFLNIFNNGTEERIFGTSLSSPIFASVLTLINDARAAAGKGPVGFVNPVLYKNPQVLNDITMGSNPNCNSTGFPTAKGWDPVTGLGTPNYPKMEKLFLSLP